MVPPAYQGSGGGTTGLRMIEAMKAWSMNFSALMMVGFTSRTTSMAANAMRKTRSQVRCGFKSSQPVPVLHEGPAQEPEEREGREGDGEPEEAEVPGEGREGENTPREGDGIRELPERGPEDRVDGYLEELEKDQPGEDVQDLDPELHVTLRSPPSRGRRP